MGHYLIILIHVVISIKTIKTQSYNEPEVEADQDYYQNADEPAYNNEQEPDNYEDDEDLADRVGNGEFENQAEEKEVEEKEVEEKEVAGVKEVKDAIEVKKEDKKPKSAMKKKPVPVQVNLDQLVEKVRERLLVDVKRPKTQRLKQKLRKTRIVAQGGPKKKKGAPNVVVGPAKNKRKQADGRIRSGGEVIEQHDLYEKTALHKGKKDSYEDYITPKKDEDALISVEETDATSPASEAKVGKMARVPKKKFKGSRLAKGRQGAGGKGGQVFWGQGGQGAGRQAVQEAEEPEEQDAQEQEEQGGGGQRGQGAGGRGEQGTERQRKKKVTKKIPKRKKKTTYVAPEYDDDTPPPTTPPLKVRTEIIGQIDYKDLSAESMAKLNEKQATAVSVKSKIVTNMQTRAKFSFSSPNYYAKLPRIAEKYNFDEPIPEKDQEEEKLKEIVNDPDVLINKKMQVNPQPTIPIQAEH